MLEIDLDTRKSTIHTLSEELLRKTLGGKGLATHLLLEHNPPGIDPLAPGNRLIFALGPVSDTLIWGGCRYGVYTKSPQTGFYAESYSGGKAAEAMSKSGFDIVMIHGRADSLIWLEICEEGAVFHNADDLTGWEAYRTEDYLKNWLKENRNNITDSAALTIGPDGENLVVFSVIENEYWRSAGRTGSGTVLGAKNVKGIGFGALEKEKSQIMKR